MTQPKPPQHATVEFPLLPQYDGRIYESLGLATARLARGSQPLRLAFAQERGGTRRLEYIAVGSTRVPVDRRGLVLTPYRGHVFSFPYIPAHKVLAGSAARKLLAGKIVLVGTSAAGLNDIRPTPVDAQYVGVETHANLVEGILEDTVLAVPSWARWFDLVQLLVLAALFAFWLPRLSQTVTFVVVILLAGAIVGVNLAAWRRSGVVLPLATPLLYLATAAVLLVNFRFFIERQRKRHLSRVFGQYVPPEIVSELDRSEADVSLEGESRDMSVLFSDVRGFTTLSEGLSPRDLTRLMNEMLTPLTRVIHTQRGTIDKYMGDAIMAFWGAPLEDVQHAEHAVHAALGMVQAAAQIRAEFATRGWPPVHIGVGVSSGAMNVGNMGSEFRMAYTVLGDAVNLGSRLESLTKQYGVDIIVSAATCAAVNSVTFRELDLVRVKGKNEPVAIFEPLGLVGAVDAATMRRVEQFTAALREYRRGNFVVAANLWREMLAERAESLIEIYLDRCRGFQQTPPPDSWDGVYVHHTK